jgi:hypothetical protein
MTWSDGGLVIESLSIFSTKNYSSFLHPQERCKLEGISYAKKILTMGI